MYLLLNGTSKFMGVFFYPINTYVNFCVYRLIPGGKVKGYDVGIEVMAQVLFVYRQEILIRAEDILQFSQVFLLLFK